MGLFEFVVFGMFGIALEVLFTGTKKFFKGDIHAEGYSFVWMFPVYGAWGLFFEPMWMLVGGMPFIVRGIMYTIFIFLFEYGFGNFYHLALGSSPWVYESKYAIQGMIRLDYAPIWFVLGLLFEVVYRFAL